MQNAQVIEQTEVAIQPAITWLNMTGDVTITWDETNRDRIIELVKQKMKERYAFFILTPRILPIFGNKKVPLTDARQLDNAVGVVVPDSQVESIVGQMGTPAQPASSQRKLGDSDVEKVVENGHAQLVDAPKTALNSPRRATTAEEVVQHQTVAVRTIVGG